MKSVLVLFGSILLTGAAAFAQSPPASENTNSAQTEASLSPHTAINAQLDSSVNTKKVKQGDTVTARTTDSVRAADNRTILPKGTKLIGHVTRASSRSKGDSDSMLGIEFDKAKMKDGQEVPLGNLMIQAVAAPSNASSAFGSNTERTTGAPSNNPSQSGSRGTRTDNSGTPSGYPGAEPASNGDPNSAGPLPPTTHGVYGIEGLGLGINSGTGETVITSKGKNVHLDSGTRLLLVPQQAASGTPGQ